MRSWRGAIRDALFVDIGTTTTDIIPIVGGVVVACGRTDPERLASGELLYTGAVRTPVEAIAQHVRVGGAAVRAVRRRVRDERRRARLARRSRRPSAVGETPDGRPAIARVRRRAPRAGAVRRPRAAGRRRRCTAMADALAGGAGGARCRGDAAGGAPSPVDSRARWWPVLGAFIAARAARAAGLDVLPLAGAHGDVRVAVRAGRGAWRCCSRNAIGPRDRPPFDAGAAGRCVAVDAVVKIGGSLLAHAEASTRCWRAVAAAPRRVLIVPGGGPFADAVRDVDAALALGDDAAHWMAVLAMDQYAQLLASRCRARAVVDDACDEIARRARRGHACRCWRRRAGCARRIRCRTRGTSRATASPRGWRAQAGASTLVLVKPPGASGGSPILISSARSRRRRARCRGDDVDALTARSPDGLKTATASVR